MSVNPSSGEGSIQWKPIQNPTGTEQKTTATASFTHQGKCYTVTVKYSKEQLQQRYGVEQSAVDAKIKEIVSSLDIQDLVALSGVMLSSSLDEVNKTIVKQIGGQENTLEQLQASNLPLYQMINKVVSVFSQFTAASHTTPSLELRVEEEVAPDATDREVRDRSGESDVQLAFERIPTREELQQIERLRDNLSDLNPAGDELLLKVVDFNKEKNRDDLSEIFHALQAIPGNAHKDEVVQLLQGSQFRQEMGEALGLINKGDVVSIYSQGKVHDIDERLAPEEGQNACGSICAEAIRHLHQGFGIETDEELENIIVDGVKNRKAQGLGNDPLPFVQVMSKYEGMSFHVVDGIDDSDSDRKSSPNLYPYIGAFPSSGGGVLDKVLQGVEDADEAVYAVLTVKGETLMIHFNAESKPVLFDSHGKPYLGMDKGASLRQFESIGALVQHLNSCYSGNPFELNLVTVQD